MPLAEHGSSQRALQRVVSGCSVATVNRLAAALLLVFSATAFAQKYQGRDLVLADVVADTTAIVSGQPVTVGVRLKIVPNWHTYWKYAGDAGIPTEIRWNLPEGWKAGEIQWPVPLKIDEPGDIQIYGYHDEVLLLQQLTPPKNLSGTTVKLAAHVSWLVCEKICIPGEGDVQLELPVGSNAQPANAELFAKYRRDVPVEWPAKISAKWTRNGGELQLHLPNSKGRASGFFPVPPANVAIAHPTRTDANGETVFHVPLVDAKVAAQSIGAVVTFSDEGGPREVYELPDNNRVAAATPATSAGHAIWRALLFGFIGGFILNLMPCVLPVISLKIFGFVQQAGKSRAKILRSGLAFAAGVFAWFLGLALVLVLLKSAGHTISWALQFTNPWFVLGMSVVVLVFALNLFGVFEINLPQWITRGASETSSREGDAGSFFQGVFATVLATPCTAPFLGTALGFAFTQSALFIFAVFTAIALGMSFPYVLLAAQPAWLKFLPKPGAWMVRVKQFMGFLLIATLIFLLYVIGEQRGVNAIAWSCALLLVISIACWIKGEFIVPTASPRAKLAASAIALLLIATSAFYFGNKFRNENVAAATPAGLTNGWQPFTPATLQSELGQGHAVFIDFTAAWCITCKFNEATVLETAAVKDAFTQRGITKLKADWTNADPEITKLLQQFGRPGVPLYVLYPGGGAQPYIFPELITKNMVLEKLETVSRNVAAQ